LVLDDISVATVSDTLQIAVPGAQAITAGQAAAILRRQPGGSRRDNGRNLLGDADR